MYSPLVDTNEEAVFVTLLQSLDTGKSGLSCADKAMSENIPSLYGVIGRSMFSCRRGSERMLPSDSASLDTIDEGASSVPLKNITVKYNVLPMNRLITYS